jgi:hypothetical protein
MASYIAQWTERLGDYAKAVLVFLPHPDSMEGMLPKAFEEAGLERFILMGACADIPTEPYRRSRQPAGALGARHSSKNKKEKEKETSGAVGLVWCTPNGFVGAAADLFGGRSSEMTMCQLCCEQLFGGIPSKYALMYDAEAAIVSRMRLWLRNLNDVITPQAISGDLNVRAVMRRERGTGIGGSADVHREQRQAGRLRRGVCDGRQSSAEGGARDRRLTSTRDIAGVVFARVKEWAMVRGVVRSGDFPLLHHAWWWALGFGNLCREPVLMPDADPHLLGN